MDEGIGNLNFMILDRSFSIENSIQNSASTERVATTLYSSPKSRADKVIQVNSSQVEEQQPLLEHKMYDSLAFDAKTKNKTQNKKMWHKFAGMAKKKRSNFVLVFVRTYSYVGCQNEVIGGEVFCLSRFTPSFQNAFSIRVEIERHGTKRKANKDREDIPIRD